MKYNDLNIHEGVIQLGDMKSLLAEAKARLKPKLNPRINVFLSAQKINDYEPFNFLILKESKRDFSTYNNRHKTKNEDVEEHIISKIQDIIYGGISFSKTKEAQNNDIFLVVIINIVCVSMHNNLFSYSIKYGRVWI